MWNPHRYRSNSYIKSGGRDGLDVGHSFKWEKKCSCLTTSYITGVMRVAKWIFRGNGQAHVFSGFERGCNIVGTRTLWEFILMVHRDVCNLLSTRIWLKVVLSEMCKTVLIKDQAQYLRILAFPTPIIAASWNKARPSSSRRVSTPILTKEQYLSAAFRSFCALLRIHCGFQFPSALYSVFHVSASVSSIQLIYSYCHSTIRGSFNPTAIKHIA